MSVQLQTQTSLTAVDAAGSRPAIEGRGVSLAHDSGTTLQAVDTKASITGPDGAGATVQLDGRVSVFDAEGHIVSTVQLKPGANEIDLGRGASLVATFDPRQGKVTQLGMAEGDTMREIRGFTEGDPDVDSAASNVSKPVIDWRGSVPQEIELSAVGRTGSLVVTRDFLQDAASIVRVPTWITARTKDDPVGNGRFAATHLPMSMFQIDARPPMSRTKQKAEGLTDSQVLDLAMRGDGGPVFQAFVRQVHEDNEPNGEAAVAAFKSGVLTALRVKAARPDVDKAAAKYENYPKVGELPTAQAQFVAKQDDKSTIEHALRTGADTPEEGEAAAKTFNTRYEGILGRHGNVAAHHFATWTLMNLRQAKGMLPAGVEDAAAAAASSKRPSSLMAAVPPTSGITVDQARSLGVAA